MPMAWASTSFFNIFFQWLLLLTNMLERIIPTFMGSLQRGAVLVIEVHLVELLRRCGERAPLVVEDHAHAADAALLTLEM